MTKAHSIYGRRLSTFGAEIQAAGDIDSKKLASRKRRSIFETKKLSFVEDKEEEKKKADAEPALALPNMPISSAGALFASADDAVDAEAVDPVALNFNPVAEDPAAVTPTTEAETEAPAPAPVVPDVVDAVADVAADAA